MRFLIGRDGKAAAKAAAKTPVRRPRRRISRGWVLAAAATLLAGALSGGGVFLYRSGRFETLTAVLAGDALVLTRDLGLVVANVEVEGRAMTSREAILRAVGAQRGTPLLAIIPAQAKAQLEALPWVRAAAVERRLPGTLSIRLVERTPLAFWQRQGKLALIDRDGVVITDERLERFPGLIVIVGADAPRHAAALLDMVKSQSDLAGRVVAAVRIGGRRWNLHLDNGIDVALPEDKPEDAWARLAELERSTRILARDLQTVDMRLPDHLVLRVTPEPPKDPPKKGRPAAKST
jgi:cell division protein FtsQ